MLAFQNKSEMKQWGSAVKGESSCGAQADFLLSVWLLISAVLFPCQGRGRGKKTGLGDCVGLKGLTAEQNKTWCSSLHFCSWKSSLKKVSVCREGGDGAEAFQGREASDQISFGASWHFFLGVLSRGVTRCGWDFARWVCTSSTTVLYFQLLNRSIKDKNVLFKFPNSNVMLNKWDVWTSVHSPHFICFNSVLGAGGLAGWLQVGLEVVYFE